MVQMSFSKAYNCSVYIWLTSPMVWVHVRSGWLERRSKTLSVPRLGQLKCLFFRFQLRPTQTIGCGLYALFEMKMASMYRIQVLFALIWPPCVYVHIDCDCLALNRPSCRWSGWHQRASLITCTLPWVTCGPTGSCCGRSSPLVSLHIEDTHNFKS